MAENLATASTAEKDAIAQELAQRVEILKGYGLGDQCAEHLLADPWVAIYAYDYSDIRPLGADDAMVAATLGTLEDAHPGARPYYIFGYHWRDEPDEDEEFTDEMAVLFIDADEAQWEAQKSGLRDDLAPYFNMRFTNGELTYGDGDYCDYLGSFHKLASGIGPVLEIAYEDEE